MTVLLFILIGCTLLMLSLMFMLMNEIHQTEVEFDRLRDEIRS